MSIFILKLVALCAPTPYTAISPLKFPNGNLIREQYKGAWMLLIISGNFYSKKYFVDFDLP